ncbi:MAG: MATE family efflux transporter, partial [Clostridia bacterium]|nr:MATE family efflux transporter [Clostridia bacterium]
IGTCYHACCLGSLVKAGGYTSFFLKNDSIFVFLVVLPSAMITAYLGLPVWVVFLCLKCDQILKCAVAVVKVNRFRWIKQIG